MGARAGTVAGPDVENLACHDSMSAAVARTPHFKQGLASIPFQSGDKRKPLYAGSAATLAALQAIILLKVTVFSKSPPLVTGHYFLARVRPSKTSWKSRRAVTNFSPSAIIR
jgi:hypothetical protein